ncbi:MAG: AAA family ATPase [Candidatus Flexifilum sp.]|jgi:energy-coupling factor transporter ATP-binding protein EcfA2
MLTRLRVRNLKRLDDIDIELGQNVLLIGPNNSGKTTVLQALALWSAGVNKWLERRANSAAERRPGVTLSRQDLINLPVTSTELLWRNLDLRQTLRADGKQITRNVRIDIIVDGITQGLVWSCGMEFDYANPESFYCRPLRLSDEKSPPRMEVPSAAGEIRIAFLPPMSGLVSEEDYLTRDSILDRIGQGRTAEILRNLCYSLANQRPDAWTAVTRIIKQLFGVSLKAPSLNRRGKIDLSYQEQTGKDFDISAAGRGMLQTLLIVAFLYNNPGSVLLLDEPDAHLEILRQREIYRRLTELAEQQGSQVIAASHSEVLLNEAADKDIVIALLGRPHRIDDRGSQVLKSLKDIGFEDYYQAARRGWVLYLEGATDLEILRRFAERLQHPAAQALAAPFFHAINSQRISIAKEHFYGLREAKPDLVGIIIVDHQTKLPESTDDLLVLHWERNEIENYLCTRETLLNYAEAEADEPLFSAVYREKMQTAIDRVAEAARIIGRRELWDPEEKASDDVLKPIFDNYYRLLEQPNLMQKRDYHTLVRHVPDGQIADEIRLKLDAIAEVAARAHPEG